MIFAALPKLVCAIALAAIGAIIGAAINWAIYQLQYFSDRKVSPWQGAEEGTSKRTTLDYVPILGWIGRRRDSNVLGKGFWLRPLLIELTWAIGLPLYYFWHTGNGLPGAAVAGVTPSVIESWFLVHTVLIALMFAATFIDFDEKMIPDSVTVPGTIFALFIAALAPWTRLPVVENGLAGKKLSFLDYASPLQPQAWHLGFEGLVVALAIYFAWYFALLPKWFDGRRMLRSFRYMPAAIIRPKRKTQSAIRIQPRRPRPEVFPLTVVWLLGTPLIVLAWMFLPGVNWTSLFSALVGLGIGAAIVWAIRIVGSYAMNQEAMGFGDVVLMAMIGAFLGWQPALLVFVLAPITSIFIALTYYILTRKQELAFGPYLCFAALLLVIFWSSMWPPASSGFFAIGGKNLMLVGGGALVAMAVMLAGIQAIKRMAGIDGYEEDTEAAQ